ncbi:hypothetical protein Ancab_005822 [Ancistrocladus abbreviatus]
MKAPQVPQAVMRTHGHLTTVHTIQEKAKPISKRIHQDRRGKQTPGRSCASSLSSSTCPTYPWAGHTATSVITSSTQALGNITCYCCCKLGTTHLKLTYH